MNKKIYYLLITFVFSLFFFVRCTDDYTTFEESNKDHNHTNEKLNNLLNYLNLNSEEDLKEHLSDFIDNDFKLNIDFHKITETKNKDGIIDKVALYAENLDSSNNVFYNIVFVKKNDEIITYLVSYALDKSSTTRRFVTKVVKSNNKRQSRCGGNEFYTVEMFSCPAGHGSDCNIGGCCNGCWRLVGQGFTSPEECDNPFPFDGSGDGGGSNGGSPNYSPEYLRLNNMIFEMNVKFGYKLTQPQWDNFHNYPAILTKFHSSVMSSEYSNATYLWAIAYLYDNISAANYFNQNPQDLNVLFALGTDNLTNTSAIADTLVELLIKGRNNDLNINSNWVTPPALKEALKEAFKLGFPYVIKLIKGVYAGLDAVIETVPGDKSNTINFINKYTVNPLRNFASIEYINYDVHTMIWKDILLAWLFELGTFPVNNNAGFGSLPTIGFVGNDYVISGVPSGLLRNLSNHKTLSNGKPQAGSVNSVRQEAINRIKEGNLTSFNREWTFGSSEVFDTMKELDGLQFVLGSYQTTVYIKSLGNPNYELTFQIKNKTGWESATRGFNNGNGNSHDDSAIPDKPRGNGLNLGGTIAQTYGWKETITIN